MNQDPALIRDRSPERGGTAPAIQMGETAAPRSASRPSVLSSQPSLAQPSPAPPVLEPWAPPPPVSRPSLSQPPSSLPSLSQAALPARYLETPTPKLAQMVQSHLWGALQGLSEYASRRPASEQEGWRAQLASLQSLLRQLRKLGPATPEARAEAPSIDPARVAEFGRTVEAARRKANLSRGELARRAGLSERTVRNVEEASNVPTHGTIARLLAVRELGLSSDDVPWRGQESAAYGAAPACWIAPGYDPLQMFSELLEVMSGSGGSLSPSHAYLDPRSAVDWFELSNHAEYVSRYRLKMPLDALARRILHESRHAKLDVIALGSGDGKQEVQLVQHLLNHAETLRQAPTLRLYLLDISQPLLSAAYQHATDMIQRRDVSVFAIQGDFNHLPKYALLHPLQERAHRRRLVTLLGSTLSHLEHEPRFFRYCLSGYAPGDLLLLDVSLACGAPERPEEIRRKDPMLRTGLPASYRTWLSGPLLRYCEGVQAVSLDLVLDTQCAVPGSYALEVQASATTSTGRAKQFSVFRFRRYEPARLSALLHELGWERVAEAAFGMEGGAPEHALLLFRRREDTGPGR